MSPDDLAPGDWIIIRNFREQSDSFGDAGHYEEAMLAQRRQNIQNIYGLPLRVEGVQLPFIAFTYPGQVGEPEFGHTSKHLWPSITTITSSAVIRPKILDLREVDFIRADDAYLKAFFPPA